MFSSTDLKGRRYSCFSNSGVKIKSFAKIKFQRVSNYGIHGRKEHLASITA